MSEADKMFEELGYKKIYDKDNTVVYVNNEMLEIQFDITYKSIDISKDTGEEVFGNTIYDSVSIKLDDLQAINEKCKELGWLDE